MLRRLTAFVITSVCAAGATQAATFSPDIATASSFFSSGYVPENTIDGSGLPGGFGPSDTHATYVFGNHWTTGINTNPVDQFIEWGFTSSTTIGGMYIWNHLSNGAADYDGYEPTLFDLSFRDSSGGTLAFFDDVPLTPDTAGASESFGFANPVANVSWVLFEVEATQLSTTSYTGLAEVLFSDTAIVTADVTLGSTTPVPLPAAAWMLIAGIAGLAGARRLRR